MVDDPIRSLSVPPTHSPGCTEPGNRTDLPWQAQHTARLLHAAGPGGMDAVPLIQQAKAHAEAVWRYKPETVVEARGRAGDVVFTHPFLVHARSTNCAPASPGGEGVRFMCHPGVRLRAHPCFGGVEQDRGRRVLTPGEKGVMAGLEAAAEVFTHDTCVAQWAQEEGAEGMQAAAPAREQQLAGNGGQAPPPGHAGRVDDRGGGDEADLPEDVDRDVWAEMGMSGFGKQPKRARRA